ncbi:hypothetical protein FRC08_017716, partial [Ceratobasidium sp. 394]
YTIIQYTPGTDDDYIVQTPREIFDHWPSLAKIGFSKLDSILPNPTNRNEAYFFARDAYALIEINPGTKDDRVVNGPKWVYQEWPSLRAARFYGPEPDYL